MRSSFLLRASIVAGIVALLSTTARPEELSESSSNVALSYQSTHGGDCMTLAAARSIHPRSHLYWHGSHHCWDATPPGARGPTTAEGPCTPWGCHRERGSGSAAAPSRA